MPRLLKSLEFVVNFLKTRRFWRVFCSIFKKRKKPVIVDGDFGGDEAQLLAVLLADPKFDILGLSCVFGNTTLKHVVNNAGSILRLLNADKRIPRFVGAAHRSSASQNLEGDNAHGEDGIGGVILTPSSIPQRDTPADDFILSQLKALPEKTLTITATGPLTNIAASYRKDPATFARIKSLIVMGGCTEMMPAKDLPERQGNITKYAEFNFYMAPEDAKTVMESGIPIVLFPMNCTHQLTFTPEREQTLRTVLATKSQDSVEKLIQMMRAAECLDQEKFGVHNVMHDIHTALYLRAPDNYQGRRGRVEVIHSDDPTYPENGKSVFISDENGNVYVQERIIDPDRGFDLLVESLRHILPAAPTYAPSTPRP